MHATSLARVVFRIFLIFLFAAAILPAPSEAQKFTVLHTFRGPDGAFPMGVLITDSEGNIYGTTYGGGGDTECPVFSFGCGTAFILNKAGKEIALYSFKGLNGALPSA